MHALRLVRDVGALARQEFDLLVIGGGISGACVAHDAALRGFSVALVDKGDFGGATSAASSKLLHSGVRYLQQARFDKVRESAREQAIFRRIAAPFAHDLPFVVPTYPGLAKGRHLVGAGLAVHRLLSIGLPDCREAEPPLPYGFRTRQELVARLPILAGLERLTGAWVLRERHMHSSERMTLAFLKSAGHRGACLANYAEVTSILEDGGVIRGATVLDLESGRELRIQARVVVNAAGPWIPSLLRRTVAGSLAQQVTAFAKGVHLVTRQVLEGVALGLTVAQRRQGLVTRGGRHVFIIPWRGRSLIGTTNVPHEGTADNVDATLDDVAEFVGDLQQALPAANLRLEDVQHAFAGLYPLTERVVRPGVFQGGVDYQLVDHARHRGPRGLVTLLGARYTTARHAAARAVDLVAATLGSRAPCQTHVTHVFGAEPAFAQTSGQPAAPSVAAGHLWHHYGTESRTLLARVEREPALGYAIDPARDTLAVEVVHAVEAEMARRLVDVVFRRTGLGTIGHPGRPALDRCAALMAPLLGWSQAECERQVDEADRAFPIRPPHRPTPAAP